MSDGDDFGASPNEDWGSGIYFLSGMGHSLPPQQPFLKRIESQNIIYGYDGDDFFEEEFDSEEAYQAAIASFVQRYDFLDKVQQVQSLQLLVADITAETPSS